MTTRDHSSTSSAIIQCPLCGRSCEVVFPEDSWQLREDTEPFRYANCPACRLMFSCPMPSDEQVAWVYQNLYDYSWFTRRRFLKRLQARHRYRRLNNIYPELFRTKGRLLDVGCGHGWFLEAAQSDGWLVEGLDLLSNDRVDRPLIPIHRGSVTDHTLPRGSYDVLTMWHMLEHTEDPRHALTEAAALLAPGGHCIIAVPNLDSAGFAKAGKRWVWCQQPFVHPWHFTAHSLQSILPYELEPVLITTRDTWDAQWLETTLPYRAALRLLQEVELGVSKLSKGMRWPILGKTADTIKFFAEEAIRLLAYALYISLRPFFGRGYEASLRGSELMIIARRRAS